MENADEPVGKLRTWWHPLLARLLTFVFDNFCEVRDEIQVGRMPLRVDLLLIRLLKKRPTARANRCARTLVELLNEFTLVEFKGPSDSIEPGDFLHFVACALLWLEQQSPRPAKRRVSLLILAPRVNRALRTDARFLNCRVRRVSRGVYRIEGLPFSAWFVETNDGVERNEPLLSLVSDDLLSKRERVVKTLEQQGQMRELLEFTMQQVTEFRTKGETFAMRHAKTEQMDDVARKLHDEVLQLFSPEERVRGVPDEIRIRGVPDEIRIRGVPDEIRVRDVPLGTRIRGADVDEMVQVMDEETRRRLLQVLNRQMAKQNHPNGGGEAK